MCVVVVGLAVRGVAAAAAAAVYECVVVAAPTGVAANVAGGFVVVGVARSTVVVDAPMPLR